MVKKTYGQIRKLINFPPVKGSLIMRKLVAESLMYEIATLLGWGKVNFSRCPDVNRDGDVYPVNRQVFESRCH